MSTPDESHPVGSSEAVTDVLEVDVERRSYARAVSHGLGLGKIEAQRYLDNLSEEELQAKSDELLEAVDVALAWAQSHEAPFADYVSELTQKGEVESAPSESLELLYRAGFDVGFSTYVVESGKVTAKPVEIE